MPEDVQALMIHGLVGKGVATEFLAFRDWVLKLPDIPAMLAGKAPIQIPERADQRYAFCAGLANALWKGLEDDALGSEQALARLERFFAISAALTSDFATLTLLDALQGSDEVSTQARTLALFSHPAFDAWSEQHGEVFQQHLEDQPFGAVTAEKELFDA
ncbi:hypothetical protein [Vreelandella azerica]|uniref:hypothetical protein n=1 Tax=Vreelandella azerica TaxID=2732867 RepID=UPI001C12064A|nr:hypothetical protein [Halomonas azerica]